MESDVAFYNSAEYKSVQFVIANESENPFLAVGGKKTKHHFGYFPYSSLNLLSEKKCQCHVLHNNQDILRAKCLNLS